MRIRIRHDSPVPLYHQIAEAIRNAVAVGDLSPGSQLPSVREGAAAWGVNLHTVRRAYGDLAREGMVLMDRRGTRVREVVVAEKGAGGVDQLVATFARTASERFGLTQMQLGQLLLKRAAAGTPMPVHFLECSEEQAAGHCAEIMASWRVEARPLVLGSTAELPAGIVVSTFFHYNDVRRRWPERTDDVRFVAIAPDPELGRELPEGGGDGGPRRLLVCELDEPKAVNIAADLSVLLPPPRYRIEPHVLSSPSTLPERGPGDVLLVAPRVWGTMSEEARKEVVLIRYRLRGYELEALGQSFGWAARGSLGAA
jgi:DNA-binding transcriptional regulator YhcF (GntR family)